MKYYIITNSIEKALLYEDLGIQYIMVDLEQLGKEERQKNLDTVKNFHTTQDVKNIRNVIKKAKVVVRINPINENSKSEIEEVINAGADIIMLPYFKKPQEVELFYNLVKNRNVKTILLFEHIDAINNMDEILKNINLDILDSIHFGLNDLSISMKIDFMFSILVLQTLNEPIRKCLDRKIQFGIGGIAGISSGKIPGEIILKEYLRLGASRTILSRSFQNEYVAKHEISEALKALKKITSKKHSMNSLNSNFNQLKKLIQ